MMDSSTFGAISDTNLDIVSTQSHTGKKQHVRFANNMQQHASDDDLFVFIVSVQAICQWININRIFIYDSKKNMCL